MDRQEAIREAARLANEYIKNRNDAEQKHKELNQLWGGQTQCKKIIMKKCSYKRVSSLI